MFEASGVVAGYGKIEVLHGVDIAVAAGESVAIVGANGAGKSTLMGVLAGLVVPSRGQLYYRGEVLPRERSDQRCRRGIVLIPENKALFRGLTVRQNIEIGAWSSSRREREERYQKVLRILPEVDEFAARFAGNCSGGQQQMCAIARGMMSNPSVLMVDELSLGLAPTVVSRLLEALAVIKDEGVAVLLVDQNVVEALATTDRAYVVEQGTIVVSGRSSDLIDDPEMVKRYVGS